MNALATVLQKRFYNYKEIGNGVITKFFPQLDRCYGFITADDGRSVFFHQTRQQMFVCKGEDEPTLKSCWQEPPVEGEAVVFAVEETPKGLRAIWWAKENLYWEAKRECENRPTYRLRERRGELPKSRLQPRPEYRTLWEGRNITELRSKYKQTWHPVQESGMFATYFEKLNVMGQWEPADDPR
jgi:cold shock CspA family protein